ncbi:MAG TPA: maleylpyruvate isomerase family mycothiol-dependent enzyme [Acidimicrobiia bacterium]|nr:maleylpyruvate isomerase family mycothiol-dependent enzyme [Acidimicrobiia bacterium]
MPTDRELVDQLTEVWESLGDFGDSLSESEWKTPTECPGWSVQDNLAHVIAIESTILDRPAPDHTAPGGTHIKNDVGAMNEIWVDWYRTRSGAEVLADFREVTAARLAQLNAADHDFGADSWTPIGPGTVRDALPFRIFDTWVHDQDMRRAVDRPGGAAGPAAATAFDRIQSMAPRSVGKKVAPPDGTTIGFTIAGPQARSFTVRMEAKRAGFVDDVAPEDADAHVSMDLDTYVRLGTGRGDPDVIVTTGDVGFSGDEDLGRAVARTLNFLF